MNDAGHAGDFMPDAVKAIRAYRANLKSQGKMAAVRVVDRCLELLKKSPNYHQIGTFPLKSGAQEGKLSEKPITSGSASTSPNTP